MYENYHKMNLTEADRSFVLIKILKVSSIDILPMIYDFKKLQCQKCASVMLNPINIFNYLT